MTKFYAIVTTLGAAKIANAVSLGTPLNITQMAVGDGGGTTPTPNASQTKLVNEVRRAAINSLTIDSANGSQIIAEQVIPETEGGFWIREMGLFAEDGTLIAVCNTAETYKPQLQEGSGRTQRLRMILIVSSTDAITLKVDPSVVLATRQYVDEQVLEVRQYADSLMAEHLKATDPHTQYAPKASPELTGTPKAPTAATGNNSTQIATTAFVAAALAALAGSAPATLDTLKELADALGNDPSFSTTVLNKLAGKMDIAKNGSDIADVSAFLKNLGLSESRFPGVTGTSRNAKMNVGTASSTATFTADEVIVSELLGGRQYRIGAFNASINLATIGAGGMDTGAVPATGFIALYAICNPTTGLSALLAVNATGAVAPEVYGGANMPAGYTLSSLISVWRVESGKFVTGYQHGRQISFPQQMVLASSVAAPSYTSLGLSQFVPLNARAVSGLANPNVSGVGYNTNLTLAASSAGTGAIYVGCGGAAIVVPFSRLQLITAQTIYYTLTAGTDLQTSYVYITGYEI